MRATVAILPRARRTWRETALALPIGLQLEPRAPTTQTPACSDLAAVVSTAIELNRNRAARQGVRLHAYVVDQAIPVSTQSALVENFDKLLGRVIASAHFGSAATCHASIIGEEVKVHVCLARPGSDASGMDIDLIDELWSWSVALTEVRVH